MYQLKSRKSPVKKAVSKGKGPRKPKSDAILSKVKPAVSYKTSIQDNGFAKAVAGEGKDMSSKSRKLQSKPKATHSKNLCDQIDDLCLSNNQVEENSNAMEEKQTRASARIRMKQELARLQADSADSDPEDSDNDAYETESESDGEVYSSAVCDTSKGKKKTPVTCSKAYFDAHKKSKSSSTSNKTLSGLKLQDISVNELNEILENAPNNLKKEREMLFEKHCSKFEKWMCMLGVGFNILLHGYGSKQRVLNAFCEKMLSDYLYVEIHGYFPRLSLKQVLCELTEDALELNGKFSSLQDHCEYVKDYFTQNDIDLYVVIHNIDGISLRSSKAQSMLAALAETPNIHLVCSVDHINAPLLWDQVMLSQFQWVWFDTTTFDPYVLETAYENSLLRDHSSNLMLSSLMHVYNSLTPNSRGVFMILAKHQKAEQKRSNLGMAFHEWYQECREAFLVNSEITMQAQISEFKNHKLLTSKKSADGIELWYIPIDISTLDQFLDNCQ